MSRRTRAGLRARERSRPSRPSSGPRLPMREHSGCVRTLSRLPLRGQLRNCRACMHEGRTGFPFQPPDEPAVTMGRRSLAAVRRRARRRDMAIGHERCAAGMTSALVSPAGFVSRARCAYPLFRPSGTFSHEGRRNTALWLRQRQRRRERALCPREPLTNPSSPLAGEGQTTAGGQGEGLGVGIAGAHAIVDGCASRSSGTFHARRARRRKPIFPMKKPAIRRAFP